MLQKIIYSMGFFLLVVGCAENNATQQIAKKIISTSDAPKAIVQVANLPAGANVDISCIAVKVE